MEEKKEIETEGFRLGVLATLVTAAALALPASAWDGAPHTAISARALQLQDDADRALFGDRAEAYAAHDCLIPDWVYRKDGSEHYVWDYVGEVLEDTSDPRFECFHLYPGPAKAYDLLSHYIRAAVAAGRAGRTNDFSSLMGVLSHMLEDWTCPPHATAGDNMMGILQSYLPPPPGKETVVLHWALETGGFSLDDVASAPRVLAASPEELAWRLLGAIERDHLAARATILPMVEAVYRGDTAACSAKQKESAVRGVRLTADCVRTVCALVRASAAGPARAVSLADVMPLEADRLVYPQSAYFWDPYWGCPTRDFTFRDGKERLPLALRRNGVRTEVKGLGFGTKEYSWFLPKGVFRRFTAECGLHADLADGATATVEVRINGASRTTFPLRGGDDARALDLTLPADATNLAIRVAGDRAVRKTYFVFGNPELHFQ